jgi:tetratricopeptide (TPR) repeat protein
LPNLRSFFSLQVAIVLLISVAAQAAAAPARGSSTVLVMPFENRSKVVGADWISEACAEILTHRMATPGLYVAHHDERVYAFDHAGVPAGVRPSRATIFRVAEQMGADFVVLGSYEVVGDQFQSSAQLLEVKNLKLHPEIRRNGALADFVSLQTSLAWTLLQEMPNPPQISEQQFAKSVPPIRLDAFESYVRGVVSTSRPQKVKYFKEALRLDPSYSEVAFELGKTYYDGHDYEQATQWFAKVPNSDASWGEANFFLGMAEYNRGNLERAYAAFTTLAARVPLTEVQNNLGVVDARRGRRSQATDYFLKAMNADPGDADYHFNLALALFKNGDNQGAIRQLREELQLKPNDSEAKSLLESINRGATFASASGASVTAPQVRVPIERIKRNYDEVSYRQLELEITNLNLQRQSK